LAGTVAGTLSGAPSTLHAVLSARDVLETVRAAGSIVGRPTVTGGVGTHAGVSLAWGVLLAGFLPRHRTVWWGAAAGLMIAALDLGVIGRRVPRVRSLPLWPQVADHLAYGMVAGWVLSGCRSR
jgi:hypothetical protein